MRRLVQIVLARLAPPIVIAIASVLLVIIMFGGNGIDTRAIR